MSFSERLSRARSSSRLKQDGYRDGQNVDLLAAVGMATARTRNRLGVAMSRALDSEGDAQALALSLNHTMRNLAKKNRWKLHPGEIRRVTEAMVAYLVDPNCQHCGGRGLVVQEQVVTTDACPHCHGTGTRPLPTEADVGITRTMKTGELDGYIRATLAGADRAHGAFLMSVKQKLGLFDK